ncbi:ATP-binding protein, partial [Tardiphaga sp.]|uniref:PAS domain-containing hybrid sensor histidine kinase/response regulator n=1 Tax=Tardiphaga sp. TaxID=1926292 RepID=UPI0037DA6DFA
GTDWSDEYRFARADGTYADVLDRGYVLRDEGGAPIRMVGAMLEVSARKAVERQLQQDRQRLAEEVEETAAERDRAEEALRQSQKMEAVGQLTGGLAHDFNNLLTGISGALEMIQLRVAQGRVNELERYSVAAQGAVRRAAALTHRLLAFARRQTLDPKPTDVNRLMFGIEELIRRTVGPQIEVETVGKAGIWTTLVDPNQLENALINLCINARDAMPEGGRITIETANKWLDERAARERDLGSGQYVSICVTDTGTGMTADVAAHAFEPFYTTKPMGEGTGLGLSMIYGFARQSGGQVRIYTEVGMGTTMCIYLPRHVAENSVVEVGAELDEKILSALNRPSAVGRVLVVDDEPTVRMLVVEVTQELGYDVIEAIDGPSALRVLENQPAIDLLITDVGLPGGMNGRQVADAMVSILPELKVLFITGFAENAVMGNGQLSPNMALVTKPFAMEVLAAKIQDIMDGV